MPSHLAGSQQRLPTLRKLVQSFCPCWVVQSSLTVIAAEVRLKCEETQALLVG